MAKFWRRITPNGGVPSRQEVEGKPVHFSDIPGVEFFIYPNEQTGYWFVCEVITGASIVSDRSRAEAIERAGYVMCLIGLGVVMAKISETTPVMELPVWEET